MKWMFIPGWATSSNLFDDIIPEGLNFHKVDFNFFGEGKFEPEGDCQADGAICYSMGSLLALRKSHLKKIIVISGFSNFVNGDKRRKLKISLMIKGLRKDPEKVLQDFYCEAGLPLQKFDFINIDNLIHGLELLRDCDMSHALCDSNAEIITIHGQEDSIVPEELNRMQFKNKHHYSLAGNHGIVKSKAGEIKKILTEII